MDTPHTDSVAYFRREQLERLTTQVCETVFEKQTDLLHATARTDQITRELLDISARSRDCVAESRRLLRRVDAGAGARANIGFD